MYNLNLAHSAINKVRGAEEECRAQGIAFLPMVAESLGGWHSGAKKGGEEAGGSAGQANRAGGEGSNLPPMGKAGIAAPEGQCVNIGQQSAIPACCQH